VVAVTHAVLRPGPSAPAPAPGSVSVGRSPSPIAKCDPQNATARHAAPGPVAGSAPKSAPTVAVPSPTPSVPTAAETRSVTAAEPRRHAPAAVAGRTEATEDDAHRLTLGISFDNAVKDLAETFPMQAKRAIDGTPMYEGKADRIGILHVFGDRADISETRLAILMPPAEQELNENLRIVQTYLRNVVPGWDDATAIAWFQRAVGTFALDNAAKPSVVVGDYRVWLSGIPTTDGLLAIVGVTPATPAEKAARTEAEVALERAIAQRAAVQRKPQKTLGMRYEQVLAGLENTFDMQPAERAGGLPGSYGSTKNRALTMRISGHKADVAAVSFTFVLGGETRDGIANFVALAPVIHNVIPEWKGFVDWFTEKRSRSLRPHTNPSRRWSAGR
jgi:hypothetical protein